MNILAKILAFLISMLFIKIMFILVSIDANMFQIMGFLIIKAGLESITITIYDSYKNGD